MNDVEGPMQDFPRFFLGGNLFGYSMSQGKTLELLTALSNESTIGVDTSSSYSMGDSERYIGEFITKTQKRSRLFISTKVGVSDCSQAKGLGSPDKILKHLKGSLSRLKTDYVDLLSLHHPDTTTELFETIEFAQSLIQEGLIRGFGISNPVASTFSEPAARAVDVFHVYGNIAHPELIEEANSLKSELSKLMVYGVFGRGVLFENPNSSVDPMSRSNLSANVRRTKSKPEVSEAQSKLSTLSISLGLAPVQILIGYVIGVGGTPVLGIRDVKKGIEILKLFEDSIEGFLIDEILTHAKAGYFATQGLDLGKPKRVV
jgi:aryl-alcohol dehydrogenase-like predicted oxidoreductase